MISRNVIRISLMSLTSALLLLLCFSINASAQAPAELQDPDAKNRATFSFNSPLKAAIDVLGRQMNLDVVFDDTIKNSKISIMVNDVTIEQALEIIFVAKG